MRTTVEIRGMAIVRSASQLLEGILDFYGLGGRCAHERIALDAVGTPRLLEIVFVKDRLWVTATVSAPPGLPLT